MRRCADCLDESFAIGPVHKARSATLATNKIVLPLRDVSPLRSPDISGVRARDDRRYEKKKKKENAREIRAQSGKFANFN